ERDEIIEVAAVKFRADKVVDIYQTLVRPLGPLPFRVQVLTGISERDLRKAPPFEAVLGDLTAFIGDLPVVGQSVGGDLKFLAHWGAELLNPIFDTHDLSRILLPTLATRGLAGLADHLGVEFTNKHRALPDCMAAKDVFLALRQKALDLDSRTLAAIVNLGAGSQWPSARFFSDVLREQAGGTTPARNVEREGVSDLGAFTEALVGRTLSGGETGRTLRPAPTAAPIDVEALAALLAPEGPLAAATPGYEHRPPQVDMLRRVTQTLNEGGELVVEAGTGTGKSLAYLLPALSYAAANGAPVVVSTNTINLQDQLIEKDIPMLLKSLRLARDRGLPGTETLPDLSDLRVVQLKGRSNYLCLRRWEALARTPLPADEVVTAARVLVWLADTRTGDRGELNLATNEMPLWNRVNARADEGGGVCSFQQRGLCFLQRARRNAANAHLIVTNHALLVTDAASDTGVLPEYRHLIVDEAHHLEDVATDQFGFRVSSREINDALNRLSQEVGGRRQQGILADLTMWLSASYEGSARSLAAAQLEPLHAAVAQARNRVAGFFTQLDGFLRTSAGDSREYGRRLRLTREVRFQAAWTAVEISWEDAGLALGDLETKTSRFYQTLASLGGDMPRAEDTLAELSAAASTLVDLRRKAASAVASPDENMVFWLAESNGREPPALSAAPVEVGNLLAQRLFEPRDAVIITSATLRSAGSFSFMKSRIGAPKAQEAALPSPFDYRSSTLVYLPQDFPEPERPGYTQAVDTALIDLARASRGRALVLFTSYAALQTAYRGIQRTLEGDKILVLAQGQDGSATQLLASFRNNERCVLLGAASFWEGVDVVGEALSLLVIAKLPFAVPSDPVVAAAAAGHPQVPAGLRAADPQQDRPRRHGGAGQAAHRPRLRQNLPRIAAGLHDSARSGAGYGRGHPAMAGGTGRRRSVRRQKRAMRKAVHGGPVPLRR
ncbi:MAG: exonuclease domain-containing protein, partial [Chloroflexi bacterium]|nr:exonuclease domain-containing protein [Chloroflexota bacterium]